MKLDVIIHGQTMGVLADISKLNRWMQAIKRAHGTFHTMHLNQK